MSYFDVASPPHIHCRFNLVENFFYFPWNDGLTYGHVLQASNYANESKIGPEIIFRFNVDTTSSWRIPCTTKGVRSFWSWSPLNLVLLHFFELSHLGDFVTNRPHFSWWTWNYLWRLLRDWRQLHLRMVFNSRRWTLLFVMQFDLSTTS